MRKTFGSINTFKLTKSGLGNDVHITTNKRMFDISVIHDFLTNSYWSKGVTKENVIGRINNSLCFGLLFLATF